MRVDVDRVTKAFIGQKALNNVSLTIEPGTLVAVLGVNGAGKSTFLRCLATLLQPSLGRITLDGLSLTRSRLELRRRLHYIPDQPVCFESFDVAAQVAFALEAYDHFPEDIANRVWQLIRETSMEDCEYKRMSTYIADLAKSTLARIVGSH